MITLDMVKRGYEAGFVRVVADQDGAGVVAEIGDMQFTFGGYDACEMDLDNYLRNYKGDRLVHSLFKGLNSMQNEVEMEDYQYCERFLNERLKELPVEPLHVEGAGRASRVPLSLNDGTRLGESLLASAVRSLAHACEVISEIREGTYQHGQAPLRFLIVTPRLSCPRISAIW